MNPRVRELYVQAFQVFSKCDENYEEMFDAFARLIISDVLTICEDAGDAGLDGHQCADEIVRKLE